MHLASEKAKPESGKSKAIGTQIDAEKTGFTQITPKARFCFA
jgi:hypothetical protein